MLRLLLLRPEREDHKGLHDPRVCVFLQLPARASHPHPFTGFLRAVYGLSRLFGDLLCDFVLLTRTLLQEDAPDNCCSRLCWQACNEARRRAVGPPGSDGKVFMHAYNSIALPDMDMLWPASKPNPTFIDVVSIVIPLLVALGSSLWKLIGVRHPLHTCVLFP